MAAPALTLVGEPCLQIEPIPSKQLQKLVASDGIASLYKLTAEHSMSSVTTTPGSITDLLHQFEEVFQEPTELPSRRDFDHQIHLLPGSAPVNVRLYRYPHFQKNDIERLVQDMLQHDIIRPSQSPFSSPVLLVKTKMVLGDFVLIIGL